MARSTWPASSAVSTAFTASSAKRCRDSSSDAKASRLSSGAVELRVVLLLVPENYRFYMGKSINLNGKQMEKEKVENRIYKADLC